MRPSVFFDPRLAPPPRSSHWGPPGYGERPREQFLPWRRPWVSLGLVALHTVGFLCAVRWGGASSAVTAYRLGAALGPVSLDAELGRVFSAGFVHPDARQWALHVLALGVGGLFVEGLLGPSRLVWLYGVSLAVSQLYALHRLPQVLGMGGSGGAMGLVGALGVLACLRRLSIPRLSRGVMLGAVALLAGSVWLLEGPGEEGAFVLARWTGAAVGAGLALSGVLTWRAPCHVWQAWRAWDVPERRAVSLSALGASGWLGVWLLGTLVLGRPWELGGFPRLERVRLPGTRVSVVVPSGAVSRAAVGREPSEGWFGEMTYGKRYMDPLVVSVTTWKQDTPVEEAHLEKETLKLRDQLLEEVEESQNQGDTPLVLLPELDWLNRRPAVSWTRAVGTRFTSLRWAMYRGGWRVDLYVLHERELSGVWAEVLDEVVQSVVVREEGAPAWDTCAAWNAAWPEVCVSFYG